MTTQIQKHLKYTKDHDWIKTEGDIATLGITDFAQSALGDIVFVELPEVGNNYNKGDSIGVIESIKSVTDLYSPISGEIVERNDEVPTSPDLCNKEPYNAWLVKIKLSNLKEIDELMDPNQYEKHCLNS